MSRTFPFFVRFRHWTWENVKVLYVQSSPPRSSHKFKMESKRKRQKINNSTWKSLDDSMCLSYDESKSLCLPNQEELGLLLTRDRSDRKLRLSEFNRLLPPDLSRMVELIFVNNNPKKLILLIRSCQLGLNGIFVVLQPNIT